MKVKNPLTLISWNVHGETGRKAEAQLAELGKLTPTPDLIALQEVTLGSVGLWRDQLLSRNYSVLVSDPELLKVEGPFLPHKNYRFRRRRNMNLIASRFPIASLPGLSMEEPTAGFPEKFLAARIVVNRSSVDLYNAHTPPGSTVEMLKVEFWEALLDRIDQSDADARVLCGDFNSPWCESDGDPAFDLTADIRRHPTSDRERWREAEYGFLNHSQMRDMYRHNRSGGPFAVSYTRGNGWQCRTACRYDHVYVAGFDLEQSRCRYREDLMRWPRTVVRCDGTRQPPPKSFKPLSDHAPVIATLVLS